jgi:hypothetical protein
MPLPAQVVDEPLTGVRVPEEGVEAKAGKTRAQHIARKNVTFSFKFEVIALLSNSAKIVGHKRPPSFRIFVAGKLLCSSPYRSRQPRLCITNYFVNRVNTVSAVGGAPIALSQYRTWCPRPIRVGEITVALPDLRHGTLSGATPPGHILRQVLSNELGINAYEVKLRVLSCNVCTHTVYFAPGFPEEAANKRWKVI